VAGNTVLESSDSNATGNGPLSLSFAAALGARLYGQANNITGTAFTMQIQAFNGASLLSTGSLTSASGAGCDTGDFAVKALQLKVAPVAPEPATSAMMLLGALMGVASLPAMRRRRERAMVITTGEPA
jgi:hypothetical protein